MGGGITALILCCFLYAFAALILSCIQVPAHPEGNANIAVFVYSNGVHADFYVPVRQGDVDWSQTLKLASGVQDDSSFRYLSFGWGDKDFYLNTPSWDDLKWKTALNALLGLGGSALRIRYTKVIPKGAHQLTLGNNQYTELTRYLEESFIRDSVGRIVILRDQSLDGRTDAFYAATGTYSLFNTCNTWTNTGLKKSGQRACLWTPFDKGIEFQYRKSLP